MGDEKINMTPNQAAFTMAWRGLESQNWKRSLDSDGQCAYRGEGGRCCGVGWMISDKYYRPDFEAQAADVRAVSRAVVQTLADLGLAEPTVGLLVRIQFAHDGGKSPEAMQASLRAAAERYRLGVPEPRGL